VVILYLVVTFERINACLQAGIEVCR